jgi:hypothetical protein
LKVVELLGVRLDYAGIVNAVRDERLCVPILAVGSIAEVAIRFAPLSPFKVRIFFGESVECIDGIKWSFDLTDLIASVMKFSCAIFLSNFMIGKRKRHSGVRKYALFTDRIRKVLAPISTRGRGKRNGSH